MPCRVIKTIKGRQYLYEQSSYRVNGKVKTESRYLGAVDSFIGSGKAVTQTEIETLLKTQDILGQAPTAESKPEKPTPAKPHEREFDNHYEPEGLTLHFLYSKMVSTWTHRHLDPTLIGLSDYSSRTSWREDTATLMAEVHNSTWTDTYKKYAKELGRAENIQFKVFMELQKMSFLDRLSGKRRAKLKEWRKLDARRRAVYQACNKLSVLAPLYDGYPESLQGSQLPFQHEEHWKAKRMTWQEKLARFHMRKKKKK